MSEPVSSRSGRPLALVTGASGGIGEELARLAARDGHDLVLVARRAVRLEALAGELRRHGTEVEVLVADLETEAGQGAVERRLAEAGDRRPVDVLVNNAGFGTVGRFVELPIDGELAQITLNVSALVRLTRAVLPRLVRVGEGGVLNVASLASFEPGPGMATYAATKAFVLSFTEAVREEVAGSGVRVCALCPGFTHTGFQARAGVRTDKLAGLAAMAWQDAPEVARTGWEGFVADRAVIVPGLLNRAAAVGVRLAPRSAVRKLSARVVRQLH
ncbi:MAG: SDR family NAD(P)-dependent oxidoreductase [Acidimicrobiales bacterium]